MRTFKKFKDREDYKNWVINICRNLEKWEKSIWEPEDEEILKPFFIWHDKDRLFGKQEIPEHIKALITIYLDKSKEYAKHRREFVDSLDKISGNMKMFFDFFMFDYNPSDEDTEEYNIDDFTISDDVPDEPFICYIWVDNGFDRTGDNEVRVLDFKTLRELDE